MAGGAISDEDYAAFLAHVRKNMTGGKLPPCPMCGSDAWGVGGPSSWHFWSLEDENSLPVITLICGKCFNVQTVAWLPIAKEFKSNG